MDHTPRINPAQSEERWRREREALEARQAGQRAAEDRRLREEREARMEAERKAKAEEVRQRAEAQLKDRLRAAYMGANPAATPADFDKAYPTLRAEHMAREAREAPEREKRALRATGQYSL